MLPAELYFEKSKPSIGRFTETILIMRPHFRERIPGSNNCVTTRSMLQDMFSAAVRNFHA
jgi:hypothetical protein